MVLLDAGLSYNYITYCGHIRIYQQFDVNSGYSTVFFVISTKLYGIYYIEEDHSMKKSRIEHVKKYSMLSLVEDLGFTLVYESSNYYHLEEHWG